MSALLDNRYQVIQVLGSGGFGETFLAEDTKMPSQRRCVIKQLKPISHSPEMDKLVQQRFQREAAILEQLGDESNQIPRLYANFCEYDKFYLVQEWVEGQTLAKKLQTEGKLDEATVRHILVNILPVLDFIHNRGIIHRDIKPENIILRQRDRLPVLIDFGAVKETLNSNINAQGGARSIVIGTPGFMPPEQSMGKPSYASDLFSLGLTAIYLLTGRNPQELSADPQTGEIIWRGYAKNVSRELAAVLDRAIRQRPSDRFRTAKDMLAALSSAPPVYGSTMTTVAVSPHATPATTQRPKRSTSKPMAGNNGAAVRIPSGIASPSLSNPQTYAFQSANKVDTKKRLLIVSSIMIGCLVGISFVVVPVVGGLINSVTKQLQQKQLPFTSPSPNLNSSAEPVKYRSFYFLADSAFPDERKAENRMQKLRENGFAQAGYFRLSDYPNLAGKPWFQVYAQEFEDSSSCVNLLKSYTKTKKDDYYCALASTDAQVPIERVWGKDMLTKETSPKSDNSTQLTEASKPNASQDNSNTANSSPDIIGVEKKPASDGAVRSYYDMINQRDYQSAWGNLSAKFQKNSAGDYEQDFLGWWDQVQAVEVQEAKLIDQTSDRAEVDVKLTYRMKDKSTSPESLRVILVWDAASKKWLFDQTQRK